MKHSVKILIACLLLQITGTAWSQEINFKVLNSQQDWLSAREEAENAGKFIFLDIYASWCGPCKMMDAQVYTDTAVYEYFNSSFVNLKVDGESEFGMELTSQYNTTAYPSMYFLMPGEQLIHLVLGYREPDALLQIGKNVKEYGMRYYDLTKAFVLNTLTAEESNEFTGLLMKFENSEILSAIASNQVSNMSEEEILNPVNKSIIMSAGGDLESPAVLILLSNAQTVKTSWGAEDFNQFMSEAFNKSLQKAVETRDYLMVEKIAEDFVPVYMADIPERIPEASLSTRKIYFAALNEWDKYIELVDKWYMDREYDNPGFLYSEVYYVIENQLFDPVVLNKCLEWMRTVVIQKPDFDSHFLMAIVETYREDYTSAKEWMLKAESYITTEDERDSINELKGFLESF